jgi:phage protein D
MATALPDARAYAPEVQVTVDSQELGPDETLDIIDLRVTLQKDQLGGFSITLDNAVAAYEQQSSSSRSVAMFKYTDRGIFDVTTEVTVAMGYAGNVQQLLFGEVATFAPTFPQGGLPMLTVTGADRLSLLRRSCPGNDVSKAFKNLADWEIAKRIADRHGLDFNATQQGLKHPIVMQKDKDDLDFLMERAKTIGYDLYIDINDQGNDRLNFVKPLDQSDSRPVQTFDYEWGTSLRSFSPQLKATRQVGSVTVRGWDPRTKQKIEYKATVADLPQTPGSGDTGPDKATDKSDVVVDMPVSSIDDARTRAVAMLERKANQFGTASGEVMGDPALRPGSIVNISGVGARFSGAYSVTKTEHVFGSGGYTTSFEVERIRENAKATQGNAT